MATTNTSPFAALVEPALVLAAAQRAERLDLPKRKSTPWAAREVEEDDEDDALDLR